MKINKKWQPYSTALKDAYLEFYATKCCLLQSHIPDASFPCELNNQSNQIKLFSSEKYAASLWILGIFAAIFVSVWRNSSRCRSSVGIISDIAPYYSRFFNCFLLWVERGCKVILYIPSVYISLSPVSGSQRPPLNLPPPLSSSSILHYISHVLSICDNNLSP